MLGNTVQFIKKPLNTEVHDLILFKRITLASLLRMKAGTSGKKFLIQVENNGGRNGSR